MVALAFAVKNLSPSVGLMAVMVGTVALYSLRPIKISIPWSILDTNATTKPRMASAEEVPIAQGKQVKI